MRQTNYFAAVALIVAFVTLALTLSGMPAAAKPPTYLVVLEHNWERHLGDKQYSEGEVIKTFFAIYKHVEVRHRYYSDAGSLKRWLSEVKEVPGPVILMVTGHGSTSGLRAGDDTVSANEIVEALGVTPNLKTIHFSTCSTFSGAFPIEIIAHLGPEHAVPITGYLEPVDWVTCQSVDLLLLDSLLNGNTPAEAVRLTRLAMPIAGTQRVSYSTVKPLGLMVLCPELVFQLNKDKPHGQEAEAHVAGPIFDTAAQGQETPGETLPRLPAAIQPNDGQRAGGQ